MVWVNGSQSSGLVNFVPESRFVTICTNQSHLPENSREGLKLVSKIALKKWNTNFRLEYSIHKTDLVPEIFRWEELKSRVPFTPCLGQDSSPIMSIISLMKLLKVNWPCVQTIQPCLWSVTTWK